MTDNTPICTHDDDPDFSPSEKLWDEFAHRWYCPLCEDYW